MRSNNFFHKLFQAGVILKGVDGALEVIGGIFLFFIDPTRINRLAALLTQHELNEDAKDVIANYLLNAASQLSLSGQLFGSAYLLFHGIIKIFLGASLLRRRIWAYPTAIIFFVIFIFYQFYRYTFTHSGWLIILTVFDIFVVLLTWWEYRRLKQSSF